MCLHISSHMEAGYEYVDVDEMSVKIWKSFLVGKLKQTKRKKIPWRDKIFNCNDVRKRVF